MHYTTLLACILAFVVAVMTIYTTVTSAPPAPSAVLAEPFYAALFGLTVALLTMMVVVMIHRANNRDLPVSSLGVMLWVSAFVMVVCNLLFSSDPGAYPFRSIHGDPSTVDTNTIEPTGFGSLVSGSLTIIFLGLMFFLPEKWHNKWLPISKH